MFEASHRLLATSGMLGYGFTEEAFRRGLDLGVDLIGCDGGSMDPGPYYLGAGVPFVSRTAAKRDLGLMVEAGAAHGVPVVDAVSAEEARKIFLDNAARVYGFEEAKLTAAA